MQLVIDPAGQIRAIYGEQIDLATLGRLDLFRAGHVEPDREGRWHADLRPLIGPVLGPFALRSLALAADSRRPARLGSHGHWRSRFWTDRRFFGWPLSSSLAFAVRSARSHFKACLSQRTRSWSLNRPASRP